MNDMILSPFSLFHSHSIQWGNLKRGEETAYHVKWTDRELKALNAIKQFRVMTLHQILALCWNGNKNGRKAIRRMIGYGIIGEHILLTYQKTGDQVQRCETPFFMPRWSSKNQEKWHTDQVLRRLTAVQLYLKIKPLSDVQFFPAVAPFTGSFLTPDEVLSIAVVKNNTAQLREAFRANKSNRMIVVLEHMNHIDTLKPYCSVETQWMVESDLFDQKQLTMWNAYATL